MISLRSIFKPALVIPLMICLVSCGPGEKAGSNDEGIIEFDTKAIDKDNPLYTLAPSSATLKFKGEKFAVEMSAYGMFKTSIIGNFKTRTLSQAVKFMDVNQACIEDERSVMDENRDFALKIEETSETRQIIGLKCYKARATKLSDPASTFDVWYTRELGMPDCNTLNAYAQLKGILIDYRVKKMGLEMHFIAKSFKRVAIDDKTFEISPATKIVSKEEMAKFFASLQ